MREKWRIDRYFEKFGKSVPGADISTVPLGHFEDSRDALYVWGFPWGLGLPHTTILRETPEGLVVGWAQATSSASDAFMNPWILSRPLNEREYHRGQTPHLALEAPHRRHVTSALGGLQAYALKVMAEVGYGDPQLLAAQVDSSKGSPTPETHLDPRQIRYFEVMSVRRTVPGGDGQIEYQEYDRPQPLRQRLIPSQLSVEDIEIARTLGVPIPSITSGLMLVSGQVDGKSYPLFLETSPLQTPIERKKFKFVWEFSRGAKTSPAGFSKALAAGLFYALAELILARGTLDDAHVFSRVLNQDTFDRITRRYGGNFFSNYPSSPEHQVIHHWFRDFLENDSIPLRQVSKTLTSVHDSLDSSLPKADRWFLAMKLLIEAQSFRTSILQTPNRGYWKQLEVTVRDFSVFRPMVLEMMTSRLPLRTDMRSDVQRVVEGLGQPLFEKDLFLDEWLVPGDSLELQRVIASLKEEWSLPAWLRRMNAIEVSIGANRNLSLQDRQGLVLAAIEQRISDLKALGVQDPEAAMLQKDVRVAVSAAETRANSGSVFIQGQDLNLPLVMSLEHSGPARDRSLNKSVIESASTKGMGGPMIYVYRLSDILSLRQSLKAPAGSSPNPKIQLRRGRLHEQMFLQQPWTFGIAP